MSCRLLQLSALVLLTLSLLAVGGCGSATTGPVTPAAIEGTPTGAEPPAGEEPTLGEEGP